MAVSSVAGAGARQGLSEPAAATATSANAPALFSGYWDYNDIESVNAGTGRREQQPQGAAARAAGPAAAARGLGSARDDRPPVETAVRTPSPLTYLIQRAENFVRDLLEVPEVLTIRVDPDAVTFTDDLLRARTFPTDGRQRDYQLSASKFGARTSWDGRQLKRELSGGGGFKIFETYFLSDDGQRMYVIIRVKAPQRPGFIAGFNRVYDRQPTGPGGVPLT
ncbi:MAG TPA: hypothetical protein VMM93_11005 [Vicinamibacterales bacterium]|nr:hypothetical protein [Vicinamibacterales bacterium]